MLQALLFSQYRMKIFADHRRYVKPVVLFKAKTIEESKNFVLAFHDMVNGLTGKTVEQIFSASPLDEVNRMAEYFTLKGISYDDLAQELRDEFSPERSISANDDKEATERQLILNSLESPENPYRAVFAVKKLDEGWDVLNLFDIVRLYETRDARNGIPGASTISEAQLIGRGARYFPFVIEADDEKYKRKFDNDIENPLRVCEELYYHCQYDSRYIAELNTALIATGIMPESQKEVNYIIKEDFRRGHFYNNGVVFFNSRKIVSRKDVNEILPSVRDKEYSFTARTGKTAMDTMMTDSITDTTVKTFKHRRTIGEIAAQNYSLVHRAVRRIDVFKFNIIRNYFPNLNTMREFITDDSYLGGVKIIIESREDTLTIGDQYEACLFVMSKIAGEISAIKETYEGTVEFTDKFFREVFRNKTRHIAEPQGEGEGISQNDSAVRSAWRLNLAEADWFVFEDDYGTSEEKSFIAYFASHVDELKKTYDNVYLVRNERQLALYSFDGGERFEPDYLLFLQKQSATGYEQYQIFVEPKGNNLLSVDKWKEDFLLQIERRGIPTKKFVDDNEYRIWGFPFYNEVNRMTEFSKAFDELKTLGGLQNDA
jgi:type III restriction enzyme